jgi:hypothetical protein
VKRHRWCLTVCLDCGLHRQTVTGADGSVIGTEYSRETILGGAKGTLTMRRAGPCDRNPPLEPGEYKFRPKTSLDQLILAGFK